MTALTSTTSPPRRRWRAAPFAILALVAAVLLALGMANPWSLLILDQTLAHPIVILTLVFGLSCVAVLRTRWPSWVKVLAAIVGILLFVLALLVVFATVAFRGLSGMGAGDETVTPAPEGRPYEAVTVEGAAMIDPTWSLSVRQTTGLLAHQWHIGCINGDNPENALTAVRWDGPNRLVLVTGDGTQVKVAVEKNGRPLGPGDPDLFGC